MEQQAFIDRIRTALGRDKGNAPTDIFTTAPSAKEEQILTTIRQRSPEQRQELLTKLREVAGPLYVDLHEQASLAETATAIATLINEKQPEWGTEKQVCRWDHPLINALELEALPELQNVAIHTAPIGAEKGVSDAQKKTFRSQVEKSFIGITCADYCVAATATLALRSRPGHGRSVSLVPSIHVAVIEESKLLATLEELYTLLKWDPAERKEGLTSNLTLISGPSKTGDIELIMVHGAHGPRELHLFVVKSTEQA